MSSPIAVLISDIHFTVSTLELASIALRTAISRAEQLKVPLVVAGDLHDSKAIIRAEVANRLISILNTTNVSVRILTGNHDLLNEKGEDHGLNYLRPYAKIIDEVEVIDNIWYIPYQNSTEKLNQVLSSLPFPGCTLIMHQGFKGANMGDYVQDKTSIDPGVVGNHRVISGHYHRHQTVGSVTYIGNPYTMSFGEANDGDKGFLILNQDGTFTREILDLRRHIILDRIMDDSGIISDKLPVLPSDTLLWVKLRGKKSILDKFNKKDFGEKILGHSNFKLDLIPDKTEIVQIRTENINDADLFDSILSQVADSDKTKNQLKKLWREII